MTTSQTDGLNLTDDPLVLDMAFACLHRAHGTEPRPIVCVRDVRDRGEYSLPWGQENRCTATTRREERCRNPITPSQVWWYHGTIHPDEAWMHESDYRMLVTGLCATHRSDHSERSDDV